MFTTIREIHKRKTGTGSVEREKMERLEQAEADLRNLKDRATKAITFLDGRNKRNHWRESIEDVIQGI